MHVLIHFIRLKKVDFSHILYVGSKSFDIIFYVSFLKYNTRQHFLKRHMAVDGALSGLHFVNNHNNFSDTTPGNWTEDVSKRMSWLQLHHIFHKFVDLFGALWPVKMETPIN